MASEFGENKYNRYGQPSLDLVFTGSKKSLRSRVGNQQVEFTRDSVGTYVDSSGLIKSAATGEARFDHDPVTGESLGLLIEEGRTNVFKNSSVPFNDGRAVTDEIHGINLYTATANIYSGVYTSAVNPGNSGFMSVNVDVEYTVSFYAKRVDGTTVSVRFVNNVGGVLTDTVNTVIPSDGERVSVKLTCTSSGSAQLFLGLSPGLSVKFGGFQVEAGSFPTSYIPTTASTVTRAADVATVSNANNVAYPPTNTLVQRPFGASAIGLPSLSITAGNTVKRISVYSGTLSQKQINGAAEKTDEFWRWRILGLSFALPTFVTDGQVTVDWGDGTVEALTASEHTFTNGGGYHDVGFRLDSGTYFRPIIAANGTHKNKVVAVGPAPESMIVDGTQAWWGCANLTSVDATFKTILANSTFYLCSGLKSIPSIDTSSASNFSNFARDCNSLTSFPLIDTSSGTDFSYAWNGCTSLTRFPLIGTSSGTNFYSAWSNCSSLTSFPLIDTSSGTSFGYAWQNCSSLTSFPLIDTSSGISFFQAWAGCNSLTSFPLIDTSSGTTFSYAWSNCSSLTIFPLIDTSSGTNFAYAWNNCSSLTSFPLIDTSSGTSFGVAWSGCSGLTSFPLIDTSSGVIFIQSWYDCSSLTSFPLIDTSSGTNFRTAWNGCNSLTSFPLIDTSSGTDFANAWYGCNSLTSFPLIDTSSGTDFEATWFGCNSLTSFPLIDTSSGTDFANAWRGCNSLTSFPASFFDSWSATPANGCFYLTWDGCSSLTPASVVNILDSIAVSGVSAPSGVGTDDKKITIDWDGTGTPATTSAAAITTLKSRNWEIYLNDVLQ